MDRELLLIITGAGISLLSGIMTLILQHFLSLRADRIMRARVEREDKQKRARSALLRGIPDVLVSTETLDLPHSVLDRASRGVDNDSLARLWRKTLEQMQGVVKKISEGGELEESERQAVLSLMNLGKMHLEHLETDAVQIADGPR